VGQLTDMIDACLTSLTIDQLPIICMSKILKIAYLTEKLEIISITSEEPWTSSDNYNQNSKN